MVVVCAKHAPAQNHRIRDISIWRLTKPRVRPDEDLTLTHAEAHQTDVPTQLSDLCDMASQSEGA